MEHIKDLHFICGECGLHFVDLTSKGDCPRCRKQKNEICICAAVRETDGTVIRGHRHRDCRDAIIRIGKKLSKKWEDEGFITSTGRFVNREEGFKLMQQVGWKSVNPQGYQLCQWLFSEDLY